MMEFTSDLAAYETLGGINSSRAATGSTVILFPDCLKNSLGRREHKLGLMCSMRAHERALKTRQATIELEIALGTLCVPWTKLWTPGSVPPVVFRFVSHLFLRRLHQMQQQQQQQVMAMTNSKHPIAIRIMIVSASTGREGGGLRKKWIIENAVWNHREGGRRIVKTRFTDVTVRPPKLDILFLGPISHPLGDASQMPRYTDCGTKQTLATLV